MIGSNNYVENTAPSIVINDEVYSDSNHNRTTASLYSNEPSGNDTPSVDYCSRNDQINGNFLCLSDNVINLDEIPISALRSKSRDLLSKRLNGIKVILSENGSPRDWRGVLNSIGLSDAVSIVQLKSDPMKEVLELWIGARKDGATVGNLQHILGNIDRWDVVDDTNDCFVEDSKMYLQMASKLRQSNTIDNQAKTFENVESTQIDDPNILTRDDVKLAKEGLPPQRYDAYLLFDPSDINFALQIIERMEEDYGLKLCVKERDLIAGSFESDIIMRMISERCDRLVVIFSNAFFENSAANSFFLKFAQALGIEQRKRKIIPCMNEAGCKLPPTLSIYFTLKYREETQYFNFWLKLYDSIQTIPKQISSPSTMPRITITEIDSPTTVPAIQARQPTIDCELPTALNKRRDKSKSPKSSSPNTPTSLKKIWNNLPKIGSQSTISSSMWTLGVTDQIFDKENERCHSSLSLNNSITSPTPTKYKKTKWFKKLLTPSSAYKMSAESDSSVGTTEHTTKKKKWYRKRFRSGSKNREAPTEL